MADIYYLENLLEEERGADNHPELWLRFSEALGVCREEVLSDTPCRGVAPFTPLSGKVEQDCTALAALFSTAVDLDDLLG